MPPETAPTSRWTTRALLAWMAEAFTRKDLDSPRLLAEMLLAHVVGCDRLRLYIDADRPATPDERERLRGLVARALDHEPVQYLVGEAWFDSLPFHVDPRVLIPRPSTATLVAAAVAHAKRSPDHPLRFADVGTGSGCVAVTVLKRLRDASAIATDVSPGALEVAATNADRHAVAERLQLREGDLLDPLATDAPLDAILSNPPYIPDDEWPAVEPNVADHEPHGALRGGPDGLRFVRPLIERSPAMLRPGGLLAIEIAAATADAVLAIARSHPDLQHPEIAEDLEGLPRVLTATRAG